MLMMWAWTFQLKVKRGDDDGVGADDDDDDVVKEGELKGPASVCSSSRGRGCCTVSGPYVALKSGVCRALWTKKDSVRVCRLEFLIRS